MKTFNVIYKVKGGAKTEAVQAETQTKALISFMEKYGLGASSVLEVIEQTPEAQAFKVITRINQNVKVEIEGVGTVAQIEIAQKLYNASAISWKSVCSAATVRLSDTLINKAINELGMYPREF